jgi:hypothetical protein
MKYQIGLGSQQSAISQGFLTPSSKPFVPSYQIVKVFGVLLNENTPSKEQFDRAGGWSSIGAIFYQDYQLSKNKTPSSVDLNTCNIALPLDSNLKNYPLVGEIVMLVDGPSYSTQIVESIGGKYYTGAINIWNNTQQNAPGNGTLGKTFTENADIRPLLPFEGDYIIQSRKGAGIRFGSTVPLYSDISEWSRNGTPDGNPITILVNGYVTTATGSLTPNIEEVNKEMSSIYMTSTQTIPLIPGASLTNPITPATPPKDYTNSQIILNSDRVTINSKKDDVLVFGKTKLELTSDNNININSGRILHLHVPYRTGKILLGTKDNNTYPTEPVLLGLQTSNMLLDLCVALQNLAAELGKAQYTDTKTNGKSDIQDIVAVQNGADQLYADINRIIGQLKSLSILSKNVYTV